MSSKQKMPPQIFDIWCKNISFSPDSKFRLVSGAGRKSFIFTLLTPLFVQFRHENSSFFKILFSWELALLGVIVEHTRKNSYSAYLVKNRTFCLEALYRLIQPLKLRMTPTASVLVTAQNLLFQSDHLNM